MILYNSLLTCTFYYNYGECYTGTADENENIYVCKCICSNVYKLVYAYLYIMYGALYGYDSMYDVCLYEMMTLN